MGWKGTMRSIAAASRRIEREQQRQLRNAHRAAMHQQKMFEMEQSRFEAEEFDEQIARLSGPHRECGEAIDWESVLHAPAPEAPERQNSHEQRAKGAVSSYRPSFGDRILRRVQKKRTELERLVSKAAEVDSHHYDESYRRYVDAHSSWESNRTLAHAILSGDLEAYEVALETLQPFRELSDFGCTFNHAFHDARVVQVAMTVDGDDCIPSEVKSLTARGKLSTKKMPVSRFNELYQDYVCGAVLRVAREFFAVLPLEWVCCTAYAEMLNPATGHKEVTPVVTVKMPRTTLLSLNFSGVDASDALRNFNHRMGFRKGSGFTAIEPLE